MAKRGHKTPFCRGERKAHHQEEHAQALPMPGGGTSHINDSTHPLLETSGNPYFRSHLRLIRSIHWRLPRQLIATTTTMLSLLLLLLLCLDLSEAQAIIHIPTSPTPDQTEEPAQAHLAQQDLDNLNKAVDDLEEDYTNLRRTMDSWPTSSVSFNPRLRTRRDEDQPRQQQKEFLCYDVTSPFAQIQKFSLTNLTDCAANPKRYDDPAPVELVILHKNDNSKLLAKSCSVLITQRIHYCDSWLWLSYGSKYLVVERPHHLTREECENIYQTRRLQISYAGKKIDLELHRVGPTIHKFWLHGKLDDRGWCTNRDFIENGELYESAMLEVIMRITTRKLESTLATDQHGTPQLGLKSHGDIIMTKYEDGFAVDRSFGTAFWEVEEKGRGNCTKDVFSVVAHSVGKLYRPRLLRPGLNDHAFLLHEDSKNNRTQTTTASALILYKRIKGGLVDCQLKEYLQDWPTFQTHIPGIYVTYKVLSKNQEPGNSGNVTMGTFKAIPTATLNLINLRAQLGNFSIHSTH